MLLFDSLSQPGFLWLRYFIVILQIQYICITIAPNVLFVWLRVLYLKNNYIFPPQLKTLYLKQPGKNNIFSVLSATDWKPFTQRSGKDVQNVHKYSTHTLSSAFALLSAYCSQTNPSNFMSCWGQLLPLIHRDWSQVHLHNWFSVFPWIPEQVCPPLVSAARTACRIQDGQLWLMMRLFSEAMGERLW